MRRFAGLRRANSTLLTTAHLNQNVAHNILVQFPASDDFTSAWFTATSSPTTLMLSDGTTFRASAAISAALMPSSGPLPVAGTDFVVVNAVVIPEPGTWVFLASVYRFPSFLRFWHHKSHRRGTETKRRHLIPLFWK